MWQTYFWIFSISIIGISDVGCSEEGRAWMYTRLVTAFMSFPTPQVWLILWVVVHVISHMGQIYSSIIKATP